MKQKYAIDCRFDSDWKNKKTLTSLKRFNNFTPIHIGIEDVFRIEFLTLEIRGINISSFVFENYKGSIDIQIKILGFCFYILRGKISEDGNNV